MDAERVDGAAHEYRQRLNWTNLDSVSINERVHAFRDGYRAALAAPEPAQAGEAVAADLERVKRELSALPRKTALTAEDFDIIARWHLSLASPPPPRRLGHGIPCNDGWHDAPKILSALEEAEIDLAYGKTFGVGPMPTSSREWFALGFRAARSSS